MVGRLRRRGGFKLDTLGNSLQKLNLIGTVVSWLWRCFTWPALPLTAGGILDKQHQEVASKRQKKHFWKNYVGIWSTCFPDSSAPKRNTDYFSSKAISNWGKIPKTKNYTAVMLGQKGLCYSNTCVIRISHCFSFSTWIWRLSVTLQPEKEWKKGGIFHRNTVSSVGSSWEPSKLGPAIPLTTICCRESALQVYKGKIQLLWEPFLDGCRSKTCF